MKTALLTASELEQRLSSEFPDAFNPDGGLSIVSVWRGGCRVRLPFQDRSLRPGGTISGPTIMMLVDVAMYVALLASIGWEPLAVTTSLNINFLKKPAARAMEAECHLLKLGKRLAVGDIAVRSEGEDDLVAHATSTYSIPAGPND
ncbi:MAG: PaaI family thioesterase [Bradyrhizobiaceae bacterium]|nr:PaaI family thioesterase [Bradyrhizobiaceae bacterium]